MRIDKDFFVKTAAQEIKELCSGDQESAVFWAERIWSKIQKAEGDRIAKARKKLGYTQAALAAALGLKQAQVARWETGACQPSPESLKSIWGLLGGPHE